MTDESSDIIYLPKEKWGCWNRYGKKLIYELGSKKNVGPKGEKGKLKQNEFAKELHVSEATIHNYFKNFKAWEWIGELTYEGIIDSTKEKHHILTEFGEKLRVAGKNGKVKEEIQPGEMEFKIQLSQKDKLLHSKSLIKTVFEEFSEKSSRIEILTDYLKLILPYIPDPRNRIQKALRNFRILCIDADEVDYFIDHVKGYDDLFETYISIKEQMTNLQEYMSSTLYKMSKEFEQLFNKHLGGAPLSNKYSFKMSLMDLLTKKKISKEPEKYSIFFDEKSAIYDVFLEKLWDTLFHDSFYIYSLFRYDENGIVPQKKMDFFKKKCKYHFLELQMNMLECYNFYMEVILPDGKISTDDFYYNIMRYVQNSFSIAKNKHKAELEELFDILPALFDQLKSFNKYIQNIQNIVEMGQSLKGKCGKCDINLVDIE